MVYSTRRFVLCLALCYFVLVSFSPFNTVITSLGEARAGLGAFQCVCSICACLVLSVSSSSWCLGWAAVCDYSLDFSLTLFFCNTNIKYDFLDNPVQVS